MKRSGTRAEAYQTNHFAKLNTGQIVRVLRYNVSVQFDQTRNDHVLILFPSKAKEMRWVFTTDIVWHYDFGDL